MTARSHNTASEASVAAYVSAANVLRTTVSDLGQMGVGVQEITQPRAGEGEQHLGHEGDVGGGALDIGQHHRSAMRTGFRPAGCGRITRHDAGSPLRSGCR